MARLFFSYSRQDEPLRDELEVALAQLKNDGIIETWSDRRITAGDDFGEEIDDNLEKADIILLLVSSSFLASGYCYEIEMTRALERHRAEEARVIPVILHPCDWKTAPFAQLQAVPRDGKPVSKYANHHDAFLEIATAVRKVAETFGRPPAAESVAIPRPAPGSPPTPKREPRSSNLRVRKEFTDHDRDQFRDASFEYLANFFEGSLKELADRNPEITTTFKRIDAQQFSARVYRGGKQVAQCGVWLDGASSWGKGIYLSHDAGRVGGGFNESLSVHDDGHLLYLKAMGMPFSGHVSSEDHLTQEGAAEYFWTLLIAPLQR